MQARDSVSLNAIGTGGVGLQVRFTWREDRHVHFVSLLVEDRPLLLLESAEGSSVDAWPPSPPLQQLSVEQLRPETQVALLVGMAGKSHWSMSVEPASERCALVFDVACRSRGPVERMGSEYLLHVDRLAAQGEHDAKIEVEGRTIHLRCDREGATSASVKNDPLGLRIEPAALHSGGTTRWRYAIELE